MDTDLCITDAIAMMNIDDQGRPHPDETSKGEVVEGGDVKGGNVMKGEVEEVAVEKPRGEQERLGWRWQC